MSITEEFEFDKEGRVAPQGAKKAFRSLFLTVVILLVALLSFGVGRLTGKKREGVTINYKNLDTKEVQSVIGGTNQSSSDAPVTASSLGTRFYYSHCGNNISEKNKVTFATASLAESAGYTLALNCSPRSR